MSKVYCGVKDLKKGERLGTMAECAKKDQIRYYGLKKIDSITLKKLTATKKKPTQTKKRTLLMKMVKLDVKIKKLEHEVKKKIPTADLSKLKKDLAKYNKNRNEIVKQLKKLGVKRSSKKGSKK